jgi:hypothetical protein
MTLDALVAWMFANPGPALFVGVLLFLVVRQLLSGGPEDGAGGWFEADECDCDCEIEDHGPEGCTRCDCEAVYDEHDGDERSGDHELWLSPCCGVHVAEDRQGLFRAPGYYCPRCDRDVPEPGWRRRAR